MSQDLPTGGFKFLDEDEKHSKFPVADMNTVFSSMADDDDIGYILEVDLEYPEVLHASHNDYPLAPDWRYQIICCHHYRRLSFQTNHHN